MSEPNVINVLIEGWTHIPHSYSLVNCYQMLALSRVEGLQVYFRRVPYFVDSWKSREMTLAGNVLTLEEENALKAITLYDHEKHADKIDVVLRVAYPYDISKHDGHRSNAHSPTPVILFYTAEFQKFQEDMFIKRTRTNNGEFTGVKKATLEDALQAHSEGWLYFMTPTQWSAEALSPENLKDAGDSDKRCTFYRVPHGVDVSKFYGLPSPRRDALRKEYDFGSDEFVFLNIGAMTGNKGIQDLIGAFYKLVRENDKENPDRNIYLVLKGLGALYNSEAYIQQHIAGFKEKCEDPHEDIRKHLTGKIIILTETMTYKEMNDLYNVADCYVSPYKAEGFNLPVLEAMSAGLPVIITEGGCTDDFVSALHDQARKIKSEKCKTNDGYSLVVDNEDLLKNMREAFQSNERARRAEACGVNYEDLSEEFGWEKIAVYLSEVIRSVCAMD